VFVLGACAPVEDAAVDKGAEEEELGPEGKSDSFRTPTEQGVLTPGVPSRVRFTEDETFHAWTFTLTGEASISLRTQQLADNLDTVMYLYRRDEGATSWGRYVAKNDDHQKNLWSQIDEDVTGPGEYRVLVKPFKSAMRGDFTMEMTCQGEGCAPAPRSFVCAEEDVAGTSIVNDACAHAALGILSAPIVPVPTGDDSMGCIVDRAQEHYLGWMGEFTDDLTLDDLSVEATRLGDAGVRVRVDMNADEDVLTYLFDAEGKMLVWYHDEQSPYWEWTCPEGEGDTSRVLEDDDRCTYHMLESLPASSIEKEVGGTISEGVGSDYALEVAFETAVEELGLSGDQEWTGQITSSGGGRFSVAGYTYVTVADWTGWTLVARTVRDQSTFYCKVSND
jgi:hypothetical protein